MKAFGRNHPLFRRTAVVLATAALALSATTTAGADMKHHTRRKPANGPGVTLVGNRVTDPAVCPGTATEAYNADYASGGDAYSLYSQERDIGADTYYANGKFGQGVDVAMIDTGVAPVKGLTSGNVKDGLDISFESQAPNLRHNDTFGHGTHMASIIAGADGDPAATNPATGRPNWQDPTQFYGVAPKARLISVKVADSEGAADVSQVIAAIDWVVQHRNDDGMHIRVLNLSYGIKPTRLSDAKAHLSDPLAFAVEQAWKAGIVVVAAAGNGGHDPGIAGLLSPASDPPIIAVGAYDNNGTVGDHSDDKSADFTSKGARRVPDVEAPGEHVLGLHAIGSTADDEIKDDCAKHASPNKAWNNPTFGPGGRFVRGRGTSQAAAVASGVVALMLSENGNLTPDHVKSALRASARQGVLERNGRVVGRGEIDAAAAFDMIFNSEIPTPKIAAYNAHGTNSIVSARGSDWQSTLPCLSPESVYWNAGAIATSYPLPPGVTALGQHYGGVCSAVANLPEKDLVAAMNVDVRGMPFDSGKHALESEIDPKTKTYVRGSGPWTPAPDGGEIWNGAEWSGSGFTADPVLGRDVWNTVSWSGADWMGRNFRGFDWTGIDFQNGAWTGRNFRDLNWLGRNLRDYTWQGEFWRDNAWS